MLLFCLNEVEIVLSPDSLRWPCCFLGNSELLKGQEVQVVKWHLVAITAKHHHILIQHYRDVSVAWLRRLMHQCRLALNLLARDFDGSGLGDLGLAEHGCFA
jgi:hypothetical protein